MKKNYPFKAFQRIAVHLISDFVMIIIVTMSYCNAITELVSKSLSRYTSDVVIAIGPVPCPPAVADSSVKLQY